MEQQQQDALRKPFPKERIQKLPTGGIQLDYVSHAWVTDRLLEVDPEWTWTPLAFDLNGLPKFDENGGLWIELTVCGVSRLGYGEPQGRDKFDQTKGAIGNAIRNAAMRFGVALDLWAKEQPVPVKSVQESVQVSPKTKPLPKPKTNQPKALDNDARLEAVYALLPIVGDVESLRTLWSENSDLLDVEYNGTTLRAYATQRKDELANA
jgi:hypothetical protein